jgi:hypothetical protein
MPGTKDKSGNDVLYYSSEAVVISYTVTSTVQLILPANPNRQGFSLYNVPANSLYLRFGNPNNEDTCRIPNDSTFDMLGILVWNGAVYARRNGTATGKVVVTEYF